MVDAKAGGREDVGVNRLRTSSRRWRALASSGRDGERMAEWFKPSKGRRHQKSIVGTGMAVGGLRNAYGVSTGPLPRL